MMTRRFLYISFDNTEAATGGGQCCERNLQSIMDTVGKENVYTLMLQPTKGHRSFFGVMDRCKGIAKGYLGALTDGYRDEILEKIGRDGITDVFIDNSQLGLMAKYIKRRFPGVRVYVFFHNMEYDYMRSVTIDSGDYKHAFWVPAAKKNERCACRYADKVIVLNDWDSRRIEELYGRKADKVIPITMKDNYHDLKDEEITECSEKKEAFFLGSYFSGNIKGLRMFCEKILPKVDIHLTIVGSGMDAFAKDVTAGIKDKVEIHSFVENLTTFYEKADFVLLPIISGGGMKVKTAESLKYGKYIIGTREALEGYAVNSEIACICKSEEDFIEAINGFDRPYKYNKASRELFRKKYSYDSSLIRFKEVLAL